MSGGLTPAKKISEIASPTQITNPNRHRRYTAANRPIPSSQSFRKLLMTPIVKNVTRENTTDGVGFAHRRLDFCHHRGRRSERDQQDDEERYDIADNELRETLPDLADFCRIALTHLDMPGPIHASTKAHTPMKMSMNTFTVAAVPGSNLADI